MIAVRSVPLGTVATIEREAVEASEIRSGSLYVGLENIQSGGRLVSVRPVEAGELRSNKFRFTSKHLLYGKLRPYLAKIARPEFEGICSTDILPLLPGPNLDRGYVAWTLLNPTLVAVANSQASGANLPRISPQALARIEIPFPPLAQQQRIAEILDKTYELTAKRRAVLAQLDALTQSIFLEMFGDPSSNPKRWPKARLKEVCERITVGIVVRPASYYKPTGVPALRSLNVKPGEISLDDLVYFSEEDNSTKLRKTRLRAGDVVLVRSGQPGTAAAVPSDLDGVNAIDLLITTPSNRICHSDFICAFFNSPTGRATVLASQRGQIQQHLNVGSLSETVLPLPPFPMQLKFARKLEVVARWKEGHLLSLRHWESLFASLQHRAFRGEL